MTTIFSDGQVGSTMETAGDFSAWTGTSTTGVGSSITVEASNPHHGSNDALAVVSAAGAGAYCYKTITSAAITYVRFYVKFISLNIAASTNRLELGGLDNGTYTYGVKAAVYNNAGTLVWYLVTQETAVYQGFLGTHTPVTGQWYCVEVLRDVTNDLETLYIDGVAEVQATRAITTNTTRALVGYFYQQGANSNSVAVDCVVVADSYVGPESAVTLQTVGDTLMLNEGVLRNKLFLITDLVGLQDSQIRNKNLWLFENVEVNDFVQALKTLAVTEAFSLTDTVFTPSKIIQITEEVSLAEVAFTGEGGVKKTRLFLILGEFALQLTGD